MLRRDITKTLLASAAGALTLRQAARAQACTQPTNPSTETAAITYPQTYAECQANVTPTRTAYPPGSVLRYGADPFGSTASDSAFNAALSCNMVVFDDHPGGGLYQIAGPILFHRNGQILRGQGVVEPNAALPYFGTTIQYRGASGGKIVSFSNGTNNLNDCLLEGVLLDGYNLANIGVEVYNDTASTSDSGTWRNKIRDCAIWNVTAGSNPTAVFLGLAHAATSFANDPVFDTVFIENTGRGFAGNGAVYRLLNCTIQACSDAAIHAGQGSFWSATGCVFSTNAWDFDGSIIQMFSASGCWFEGSTHGVYRAATSHTATFEGCLFQTNNSASFMDFQSAAGNVAIRSCEFGQGNNSTAIANPNYTASYDFGLTGISGGYGNGAVRSASATLAAGQQLVLLLGRGTFFVGVNVWWTQSANVRSQATYSAFLFDGDNEGIGLIASRTGSGGGLSYNLLPSTNSVTFTNTGTQTVNLFISGTGVPG